MKAIKSDSDSDSDEQKRSPGFSGKNRGATAPVAAPGVTHPSDATGQGLAMLQNKSMWASSAIASIVYKCKKNCSLYECYWRHSELHIKNNKK